MKLPQLTTQLDSATVAGIITIAAIAGLVAMKKGFASISLD